MLCHVWNFVTPWIAACQASLSFTISQSSLRLLSFELVMPSNHLILFSSCPHSFPESGSFPASWLFTSGNQSIIASISLSVFPMNIQGWLDNVNIKNYFQDIVLSTVYLLLTEINEGEQKIHHQLRELHLKRIKYFIFTSRQIWSLPNKVPKGNYRDKSLGNTFLQFRRGKKKKKKRFSFHNIPNLTDKNILPYSISDSGR